MTGLSLRLFAGLALTVCAAAETAGEYNFGSGQTFLRTYCKGCHEGESPVAGFDLRKLSSAESLQGDIQVEAGGFSCEKRRDAAEGISGSIG